MTLPLLKDAGIFYLAPKSSSKILPCDAGIIAAISMRCRRMQTYRTFAFIDKADFAAEDIYKVNQLLIRWMKKIWE